MLPFLIRFAVVALIVYAIWSALRPRYPVRIEMDEQGIRNHRGLPKHKEREVLRFFREEIAPSGRVVVQAIRRPSGYWRLAVKGQLDPGALQRIRNFLNTEL